MDIYSPRNRFGPFTNLMPDIPIKYTEKSQAKEKKITFCLGFLNVKKPDLECIQSDNPSSNTLGKQRPLKQGEKQLIFFINQLNVVRIITRMVI